MTEVEIYNNVTRPFHVQHLYCMHLALRGTKDTPFPIFRCQLFVIASKYVVTVSSFLYKRVTCRFKVIKIFFLQIICVSITCNRLSDKILLFQISKNTFLNQLKILSHSLFTYKFEVEELLPRKATLIKTFNFLKVAVC